MVIENSIDDFYDELKNTHKQLCPEYSFYELWNELIDDYKKVSFDQIENNRILLLIKISAFNLSIDYSNEKWVPINGYNGVYEISDKGRVRRKNNQCYTMMHFDISPLGYKRVNLSLNNIAKKHLVHRLVAEAFIENPNDLPIVNHKDERPWNNTVENLEWCTYSYNNSYNDLNKRRFDTKTKNVKSGKTKLGTPIVQLDLSNNFVREWTNAEKVKDELGIDPSFIHKCCKHISSHKTAYGYKWLYKNEYLERYNNES